MKICNFEYQNKRSWGILKNDIISPLENLTDLKFAPQAEKLTNGLSLNEVKIFPPVAPSKIICVGRNYAAHAAEFGNKIPKEPMLFLKAPSALITDNEHIILPPHSNQVEFEGELGVVIGKDCKNLSVEENSSEYIFGYICLNDVTARDLQKTDVQFTRAKSFDTFCPIGAFVETELDTSNLRITTKVNGEVKQTGQTSQMVFSVEFLIKYISNQMTLKTGDVIATGTPAGVSRIKDGDVCEIEIEGIGILRNPVKN